jgi:predicted O-methyltransferase YrrM
MLTRIGDFFSFFSLDDEERARAQREAARAAHRAGDMTHLRDYEALAAACLYVKPGRVFEIGTYLGVTSDFLLALVPETRVVSIAFVNADSNESANRFNNSELGKDRVGSMVQPLHRGRFTQLYGNSHALEPAALVRDYGRFDLVFIDGDHSRDGVSLDTILARQVISERGMICWHDANPKPRYMAVRHYLEQERSFSAIATRDNYIGGVACWSADTERLLMSRDPTRQA